ncbi:MAG TPA: hypothetical protein PKD63_04400 [Solirubrobacteraceae bacterium]|nr:hypothetical protein [Solirubrobacteraceae bacterium]
MFRTTPARLTITGALLLLAAMPAVAEAERYRRSFPWSGYRWQVRLATGEDPGHNDWGDSARNVRVRPDGTLRLAIVRDGSKRRSVELATVRRLGYGRYRWVVGSKLGRLDHFSVLALFTNDTVHRAPYGEQDFEFTHWGNAGAPPGWAVSWSQRVKAFDGFSLSNLAPYTIDITWRLSVVRFHMRDGGGVVLYDVTRPMLSNGRFMAARMSYWLFPGFPRELLPPPVIVRDFEFTPLSRLPSPR